MRYNYSAPCSKNNLVDIRNFVNDALKNHISCEKDIHSLVLAVDEVCANLMIHSHQCNPSKSIEVSMNIDHAQIIFEITDTGNGFNFDEYCEPSIEEIILEKKKGGIGLMLVKRIMDHIEYIRGKNYNLYRLKKNYNS